MSRKRLYPGCGRAGRDIVVAGGTASTSSEILDLDSLTWRAGPAVNATKSYGHPAAVQLAETFLLVGGKDQGDGDIDAVLEYDPAGEAWITRNETVPGSTGGENLIVVAVPDEFRDC